MNQDIFSVLSKIWLQLTLINHVEILKMSYEAGTIKKEKYQKALVECMETLNASMKLGGSDSV